MLCRHIQTIFSFFFLATLVRDTQQEISCSIRSRCLSIIAKAWRNEAKLKFSQEDSLLAHFLFSSNHSLTSSPWFSCQFMVFHFLLRSKCQSLYNTFYFILIHSFCFSVSPPHWNNSLCIMLLETHQPWISRTEPHLFCDFSRIAAISVFVHWTSGFSVCWTFTQHMLASKMKL